MTKSSRKRLQNIKKVNTERAITKILKKETGTVLRNGKEERVIKTLLIADLSGNETAEFVKEREDIRRSSSVSALVAEVDSQSSFRKNLDILQDRLLGSQTYQNYAKKDDLVRLLIGIIDRKDELLQRKRKGRQSSDSDTDSFYSISQFQCMVKDFEDKKSSNLKARGKDLVQESIEPVEPDFCGPLNIFIARLSSVLSERVEGSPHIYKYVVPFEETGFRDFCDNLSDVSGEQNRTFCGCFDQFKQVFSNSGNGPQQAVSSILALCFGKNQKSNQLQARVGCFIRANNVSKTVINFLNGLGFCSAYETVLRNEKRQKKAHFGRLGKVISKRRKGRRRLVIQATDDFHNISKLGRSRKGEKTNAQHMTTSVLRVVEHVDAAMSREGIDGIPIANASAAWQNLSNSPVGIDPQCDVVEERKSDLAWHPDDVFEPLATIAKEDDDLSNRKAEELPSLNADTKTFINYVYLSKSMRETPDIFLSLNAATTEHGAVTFFENILEKDGINLISNETYLARQLCDHYSDAKVKCPRKDNPAGPPCDPDCFCGDRRMKETDLVFMIDDDLKNIDQISNVWRKLFDNVPEMVETLSDTYVPHPGDCPCQTQMKRFLIAVKHGRFNSKFTDKEKDALAHVVPFVGPLHISLNGIEDLIVQYR